MANYTPETPSSYGSLCTPEKALTVWEGRKWIGMEVSSFFGDEWRRVIRYFVSRSARPQHAGLNGSVGFLKEPHTGHVPGVVAPGHVPRPGSVTRTDPKGSGGSGASCLNVEA